MLAGARRAGRLFASIELELLGAEHLRQKLRRRDYPVADCCKQTVGVAVGELLQSSGEALAREDLRDAQVQPGQLAFKQGHPKLTRAVGLLLAQPLPDTAFGPRRDDVIGPVFSWILTL